MPAALPFRPSPSSRRAWLVLLVFTLWAVVGVSWFMRHYFGLVTPDQVLFHLQHGGLGEADGRLQWRALRCLAGVVALTALSLLLLGRLRRWPRWPLLGLLGVGAVVSVQATVADPCEPEPDGSDYLARHYVAPDRVHWAVPAVRPDVLLVFVESLDQAYTRPRDPAAALLPALARWQGEMQTLGQLRNLSGASWTMGGLFGALCGLPLQPVGVMSRNAFEYASQFFAGGSCLTDVLAAQGWQLSFYGGASLRFAGKGQFLQDHGVGRRFGAEQWRQAGVPVPSQGWGLLDSALVDQVLADLQRPVAGSASSRMWMCCPRWLRPSACVGRRSRTGWAWACRCWPRPSPRRSWSATAWRAWTAACPADRRSSSGCGWRGADSRRVVARWARKASVPASRSHRCRHERPASPPAELPDAAARPAAPCGRAAPRA